MEDFEPATFDFSDMRVIISGPSLFFIAQISEVVIAEEEYQPLKLVGLLARGASDFIEVIEIESCWYGREELKLLI